METLKPNSNRYKEAMKQTQEKPVKKVDKVIKGKAKVRKKGGLAKMRDLFISEDATNIKSYIVLDVLIPAMKKAIHDIVTNGIDMILYDGKGAPQTTKASKISYRDYYGRDERKYERREHYNTYSYDQITVDTRGEAEEVLDRMIELIQTYGQVSVADFCDLVGVTGQYTDNKYGWDNLRNATVIRVQDGYAFKLPKALPLNSLK